MAKITLPKETMLSILERETEVVSTEMVDTSRWSIIYEMIFKYNDKFYRTCYSVGATETQDESPWEYEDEVDCFEVHQVEKTVLVWEAV